MGANQAASYERYRPTKCLSIDGKTLARFPRLNSTLSTRGKKMTEKDDEIQLMDKMVVTVDICSSSHIVENLLKRSKIEVWKNTLIDLKEYLYGEAQNHEAEIYKFTGDGWIILFNQPYLEKRIIGFLKDINLFYKNLYEKQVLHTIDIPPKLTGMTFGVDEGPLVKLKMLEIWEYLGRALNIACRLQGAINEIDIYGGYRVFLSHIAYNMLKKEADHYSPDATERLLKNISYNPDFQCYRLAIDEAKFRIIKAVYGTQNRQIDVTKQYENRIENGKLDVIVSNEIAKEDPDKGIIKLLTISFLKDGKEIEKQAKEGSRIQLP